jgi:hypothetical protein
MNCFFSDDSEEELPDQAELEAPTSKLGSTPRGELGMPKAKLDSMSTGFSQGQLDAMGHSAGPDDLSEAVTDVPTNAPTGHELEESSRQGSIIRHDIDSSNHVLDAGDDFAFMQQRFQDHATQQLQLSDTLLEALEEEKHAHADGFQAFHRVVEDLTAALAAARHERFEEARTHSAELEARYQQEEGRWRAEVENLQSQIQKLCTMASSDGRRIGHDHLTADVPSTSASRMLVAELRGELLHATDDHVSHETAAAAEASYRKTAQREVQHIKSTQRPADMPWKARTIFETSMHDRTLEGTALGNDLATASDIQHADPECFRREMSIYGVSSVVDRCSMNPSSPSLVNGSSLPNPTDGSRDKILGTPSLARDGYSPGPAMPKPVLLKLFSDAVLRIPSCAATSLITSTAEDSPVVNVLETQSMRDIAAQQSHGTVDAMSFMGPSVWDLSHIHTAPSTVKSEAESPVPLDAYVPAATSSPLPFQLEEEPHRAAGGIHTLSMSAASSPSMIHPSPSHSRCNPGRSPLLPSCSESSKLGIKGEGVSTPRREVDGGLDAWLRSLTDEFSNRERSLDKFLATLNFEATPVGRRHIPDTLLPEPVPVLLGNSSIATSTEISSGHPVGAEHVAGYEPILGVPRRHSTPSMSSSSTALAAPEALWSLPLAGDIRHVLTPRRESREGSAATCVHATSLQLETRDLSDSASTTPRSGSKARSITPPLRPRHQGGVSLASRQVPVPSMISVSATSGRTPCGVSFEVPASRLDPLSGHTRLLQAAQHLTLASPTSGRATEDILGPAHSTSPRDSFYAVPGWVLCQPPDMERNQLVSGVAVPALSNAWNEIVR